MGTTTPCCVQERTLQQPEPSFLNVTSSFLVSDSANDSRFVYYYRMHELNQYMRLIISKHQEMRKPETPTLLSVYLAEINSQLSDLADQNSELSKRIKAIDSQLLSHVPRKGYLVFQIQKIEFVNTRLKMINIEITGSEPQHSFMYSGDISNNRVDLKGQAIVQWSIAKTGKVKIKVQHTVCTLDLNEVENQIVVLEGLNLKKPGMVDPIGKMIVRVQYIQFVELWKERFKNYLNLKRKQIQAILDTLKQDDDGDWEVKSTRSEQVYVSVLGELNTKYNTSFYENDFEI